MTTCSIDWCACMATEGDKCAVHAKDPNAKTSDYECLVCEDTEECQDCEGSGDEECVCSCGDWHESTCNTCNGTGDCQACIKKETK